MHQAHAATTPWTKSSYSNADQACIEVAVIETVRIRDSKLAEESPIIGISATRWDGLVQHLKAD